MVNLNPESTMTKQQALAEARKRWGKNAIVRFNRGAFRKADRTTASADLKSHRAEKPQRPVPVTPEYTVAWRAWKVEEDRLMGICLHYPCDVGDSFTLPMFGAGFAVKGSGDTWEEAFAAVKI
jgi:hypothetical protein